MFLTLPQSTDITNAFSFAKMLFIQNNSQVTAVTHTKGINRNLLR